MSDIYQPFQPLLTNAGLQRFELFLQQARVSSALKGVVHSCLQINTAKPTLYPVIPDGTQAIFMSPHGSIIGGSQTRAVDMPLFQPGEYFGIRFYPAALRNFFKLDLSEITNQYVDSGYFPVQSFSRLHQAVYQSQSFQQRVGICERWLLSAFKPVASNTFDQALYLIFSSCGNIKVNQLASKIGLSSRHLNRLFRQYTGLSTKLFTQVIRIQHSCKRLCIRPNESLLTALDLGYFDQAHLVHDYNKLLLASPKALFNRFMSDFSKN